MSFISDEKTKNDLADYQELIRSAAQINSTLSVWAGKCEALCMSVTDDKKAELAATRAQFETDIKATLGL